LGFQALKPIRPFGRVTLASSAATFAWSGAKINPKFESTTSKLESS